MNTKFSFLVTLIISIVIQVIATIVESYALLVKIPVEFILLRQLLIVEVLVEFIQAVFCYLNQCVRLIFCTCHAISSIFQ